MNALTDEQEQLLDQLRTDLVETCIRLNKRRRSLTRAIWAKEYDRLMAAAKPLPKGADFDMEPLAMMEPGLNKRSG
jgi:hypothetical protein